MTAPAHPHRRPRPAWSLALVLAAAVALPAGLGGCVVGQLVGGMAASAQRSGSKTVKAKYTGLKGKTFAVIVAADRSIQADHPAIVEVVTNEITRRLVEHAGASGVVPAADVLRYQFQNPGWVARSPTELQADFGVDRLILVDLQEYTLTDPGNAYIWAGVAGGLVQVLEAGTEQGTAGEFAFKESIRVRFPDEQGTTASSVPASTVQLELTRRFVRRASWLFYDHEEPNIITY